MLIRPFTGTLLIAILVLVASLSLSASTKCEDLSGLRLADTTITSAQAVAAGAFVKPGTPAPGDSGYKDLPAFCRVTAEIKPSKDSEIKMELWMPLSGWNGRYEGVGNGGFAGEIVYQGLAGALRHGSAAASTDTGHAGSPIDGSWALGHPEKIADFGYRAIHEMTVTSKALIKAFYGDAPRHSYFAGCSNGGRQALIEAQRFPEDYDGIIAGAPAYHWTHLLGGAVYDAQATLGDPASYIPASKIPAISAAVLAACDAQDGLKDGLLSNPVECRFDPASMVCKPGESADTGSCLTGPQAVALQKIYAGPKTSKGEQVRPGFPPGGEEGGGGWGLWITGQRPGQALLFAFANGFFKNMVYDDPNWDFKSANLDAVVQAGDEKQAHNLNATDTNLKAFRQRGGKLIIYHGWSDPAIPAQGTLNYYNNLADNRSSPLGLFARLFLAPGMQHCAGGPGPDSVGQFERSTTPDDPQRNIYSAIEQWVEKGKAPDKLIATKTVKGEIKISRPLCPSPQVAAYKGSGDVNQAENWECSIAGGATGKPRSAGNQKK